VTGTSLVSSEVARGASSEAPHAEQNRDPGGFG